MISLLAPVYCNRSYSRMKAPPLIVLVLLAMMAGSTAGLAQSNFWRPLEGINGGRTGLIARDSSGNILVSRELGLIRSSDDGHSWNRIDFSADEVKWIQVAPWGDYFAATDNNIMRSRDQGATWSIWKESSNLYIDPAGWLYLERGRGVYRSQDSGSTWTTVIPNANNALILLPNGTLMTQKEGRTIRSTDHGTTWEQQNETVYGNLIVGDSGKLYVRQADTIHCSTDGGDTWRVTARPIPRGIINIMYHKGTLLGLAPWKSTNIVVRSRDDGKSWSEAGSAERILTRMMTAPSGDLLATGYNGIARSGDTGMSWGLSSKGIHGYLGLGVSAASNGVIGVQTRLSDYPASISTDSGSTWTPIPRTDIRSIVTDPSGNIFIHAAASILRSADSGRTWSDVTNGIPATEAKRYIWDWGLRPHPNREVCFCADSLLYVWADTGWRSRPFFFPDRLKCLPDAISRTGTLYSIISTTYTDADHFVQQSSTLYRSGDSGITWASVRGEHGDLYNNVNLFPTAIAIDDSNYVYVKLVEDFLARSGDEGKTWEKVTSVAQGVYGITSLAIDSSSVFYMGAASGVYWSFNKGLSWGRINGGLTDLNVRYLAVAPGNRVLAGTYREGAFLAATDRPHPDLWIRPGALQFSDDTTGTLAATIWSLGNIPIEVDSIVSAHPAFLLHDTGRQSIAPGASSDIQVTFLPQARSQQGVIVVYSNAPSSPDTLGVSGTTNQWSGVLEENEAATGREILEQPRPNPLHDDLFVTVVMPGAGRGTLELIDQLGTTVAVLIDTDLSAGSHTLHLDGRQGALRVMAEGLYFLRFRTGSNVQVRQLILSR